LARQIKGVYKVKSPGLKPLHERARQMIARLESFSIQHVRREENEAADRLANQTLDRVEQRAGHRGVAAPPPAPLPSRRGESRAGHKAVVVPLAPLPLWGSGSGAGEQSPDNAAKISEPLRATAAFHKGLLEPQGQLPLVEGEIVDLEIYRKE